MTWARLGGLAGGLALKVSVPAPLPRLKLEVRPLPAASVTWMVVGPVAVTMMLGKAANWAWTARAIAAEVPAAMGAVVNATPLMFPVITSPAAGTREMFWIWEVATWPALKS